VQPLLTIVVSRLPRAELGIDWFALALVPDVPRAPRKCAIGVMRKATISTVNPPRLADGRKPRS
jgi:hypothetical protein